MDFGNLDGKRVHPEILHFAKFCLELAGASPLPHKNDFDPMQVIPVLGNVYLLEIAPDGDYIPSLFGVHMAVLYDGDLTQYPLSSFPNPDLRDSLKRTYDGVVESRRPLYQRGRYVWPDKSVGIERLLVPLTDDAGRVDALLVMVVLDVSVDELETFRGSMPDCLAVEESVPCGIAERVA
jgi:hypothetical protein